jgi:hypothetical protein
LVHPRQFRVSREWQEGRIAEEAVLPAWLTADATPEEIWRQKAFVWETPPDPGRLVVATLCRHAQKYPLTAQALDLWDAAHGHPTEVVIAEIPDVQKALALDRLRLMLAPLIGSRRHAGVTQEN